MTVGFPFLPNQASCSSRNCAPNAPQRQDSRSTMLQQTPRHGFEHVKKSDDDIRRPTQERSTYWTTRWEFSDSSTAEVFASRPPWQGEANSARPFIMMVLHKDVDHAVQRGAYLVLHPAVAHILSVSLTLLLRDTSFLVRLFYSRPSPARHRRTRSLSSPSPCVARKSVASFPEYLSYPFRLSGDRNGNGGVVWVGGPPIFLLLVSTME